MVAFKVLSPGLSTTIQDLGRERCLDLGIPVGGSADVFSHRIANAVLANGSSWGRKNVSGASVSPAGG